MCSSFGTNLAQTVFSAFAASKLATGRLELEITESALLQEGNSTRDTLHQLRTFSVRLAIEDFGTGYKIATLAEGRKPKRSADLLQPQGLRKCEVKLSLKQTRTRSRSHG
jgi:EAL domain